MIIKIINRFIIVSALPLLASKWRDVSNQQCSKILCYRCYRMPLVSTINFVKADRELIDLIEPNTFAVTNAFFTTVVLYSVSVLFEGNDGFLILDLYWSFCNIVSVCHNCRKHSLRSILMLTYYVNLWKNLMLEIVAHSIYQYL